MNSPAYFSVNPRLTRLLGETYRSSEAALKELVDNAWDADALNVWIDIPPTLTSAPIVVKDDGLGMSEDQIRSNYLDIANDRRRRSGEITTQLKRKVKGRKGIGKFAGLILAESMKLISYRENRKCSLVIDKTSILNTQEDLETIPLEFVAENAKGDETGSLVELSNLDQNLNYPIPENLKNYYFVNMVRKNFLRFTSMIKLLDLLTYSGIKLKRKNMSMTLVTLF